MVVQDESLAPLPAARLKVCLALLAERDVVQWTPRGGYRLLRTGLSREERERAGLS